MNSEYQNPPSRPSHIHKHHHHPEKSQTYMFLYEDRSVLLGLAIKPAFNVWPPSARQRNALLARSYLYSRYEYWYGPLE